MGTVVRRLCLALIVSAPLALGAQEAVTLDQSLGFNYNLNRTEQAGFSAATSLQQATYSLSLGMPILEYRLGALNVAGALDYLKERNNSAHDSNFDLSSVGISGALFPYQPYHLNFDYSKTLSPGLFGDEPEKSQTFGLNLSYRGTTVEQIEVDFRHGEQAGVMGHQDWFFLRTHGVQTLSDTILQYRADHIDFRSQNGNGLASSSASLDARTPLGKDWSLQDSLGVQVISDSKNVQASVNLTGTYDGWTSLSAVTANYLDVQSQAAEGLSFGQSLARTWGQLSAFAEAGVSGQRGNGTTDLTENVTLGATYQLTPGCFLTGDGGLAKGGTAYPVSGNVSTGGVATSFHVGLALGGGVPELLKHVLFYWSDLGLRNRLQQDYPPGYVPPELASVLFERRMSREGDTQFTCDLTHLQNGASGKEDWTRVSGSLSFRNGVMVRALGDWRKDDGFSIPSALVVDKDCSLSAVFSLARTRVNLGWGYNRSDSSIPVPAADLINPPAFAPLPTHSQVFSSLGIESSSWGIPWGALFMKQSDALGVKTNTFATHVSTTFRNVAWSVSFSRASQSNGIRNSQVNVSLRRWFDTISLWGQDN